MKLAIVGKGGVGKTTIAAALSRIYADEGYKVLAIDADPDANLASALGIPMDEANKIVPLAEMKDLVQERTGAQPGYTGGFFKLNPKVDDIPERYAKEHSGVKLLVMGAVKSGGTGCVCPESALLRSLLRHLIVDRDEVVIMDMEAGIEHLGRGTAESVDAFLIVVEPSLKSIQTAQSVIRMARDIGVKKFLVVANKIGREKEVEQLKKSLLEGDFLGVISYNPEIQQADFEGKPAYEVSASFAEEIKNIKKKLEEAVRE